VNLNQNRRDFLSILAGAGAGLAFDPEMLGWVKHKTIFIPKPQLFHLKFYSVDIQISQSDLLPDNQLEFWKDLFKFQEACERNRSRLFTRQIV